MSKIAVVYWSGTGNTQAMAQAVADGIQAKGGEAVLFTAPEFGPEQMDDFSAIAFGCPSMGAEQLEESEFEPMFSACETKLASKKMAIFGSYGWGDGEWMRIWTDRMKEAGASIVGEEGLICNNEPDETAKAACEELGKKLVSA